MNELQKINAEAERRLNRLASEFQSEIETWYMNQYASGNLYPDPENMPFNQAMWLNRSTAITTDAIIASVKAGLDNTFMIASVQQTSKYFLNLEIEGFTLSDRLRDSARTAEKIARDTIQQHITAKTTVKRIVNDLTRQTISRGDLPKYLLDLENAVKLANGDTIKTRQLLKNARARIEKLTMKDQPLSALKKSYSAVVDAVESGDSSAVAKKLEKALKEKVIVNNTRIARTEISNAYSMAFDRKIQDHPDFSEGHVYVRLMLSPRHGILDLCDHYTSVDLYGLGSGIYPYDTAPRVPLHPNCLCQYQAVVDFRDKRTVKESSSRREDYYSKLPEDKAKKIRKSVESTPVRKLKPLPKDQVINATLI